MRLILAGDLMTGRGIDQVLSHPGSPVLHEAHMRDARDHVRLAESAYGPVPAPGPTVAGDQHAGPLPGAHPGARIAVATPVTARLTDLYELTLFQACLDEGLVALAVFELFVRRLPPERSVLVAAGLQQAPGHLESLRFEEAELDWLAGQGGFPPRCLDALRDLRFTGDVDAMPEGPPFFADEPVLRVTAPLPPALGQSRADHGRPMQALAPSLRGLAPVDPGYPVVSRTHCTRSPARWTPRRADLGFRSTAQGLATAMRRLSARCGARARAVSVQTRAARLRAAKRPGRDPARPLARRASA